MADDSRYGEELFSQSAADETARLAAEADAYDPISIARLRELGVGPGWRCADIGAGPGSITAWLAAEVAPADVYAVDLDTTLLEPLTHKFSNVRAVRADVTEPSVDLGTFDVIHARFVLMHLRERLDVIDRLASWLRPGGWIVLSEAIDVTTEASPDEPFARVMRAMWTVLRETIGTDIRWVRGYADLLGQRGLVDVDQAVHLPSTRAGSAVSRFWGLTLVAMRQQLLDSGLVTTTEFERALEALSDPTRTDLGPGMITAWGRRPPQP